MSTRENSGKLEGFAEITCHRNDMFWKFSQYRTTADGQSEWFKATWIGYNDANWWNNVAPAARQIKCTGDKGTTVILEIDFRTNHVGEVTAHTHKEEPKPEPKLPSWCKEGQWVTESHPEHSLGRIVRIHSDNYVGIVWVRHIDGLDGSNRPVKYLKPIRFRPYTFEEAEKLFLKTIQYTRVFRRSSLRKGSEIVTSVIEGDEGLWINGTTFNILANDFHATIDGIPVGVPEVDEKALKKALKEVNHE